MPTVACIDDDPIFADAFTRNLRAREIELTHFEQAARFLETTQVGDFDLVLVDLTMAGSNGVVWEFAGIEVVKTIRKRFGDEVPVWVLTGHDNPYLAQSSTKNGADRFLQKYDGMDRIGAQVSAYLDKARTGRSARQAKGSPTPTAN